MTKRVIAEQVNDENPLCVPVEKAMWGLSATETIPIPRQVSGKKLVMVRIAPHSQVDKVLIRTGSNDGAYLLGRFNPWFVRDRSISRDFVASPWGLFNTAGLNNIGGTLELAPWLPDSSYPVPYTSALLDWRIATPTSDALLNPATAQSMGGFVSLECWYGDYPRIHSPYREDWDIGGYLKITNDVYTWRNIVTGRREWVASIVETSGITTLDWEIFGVLESMRGSNSTRRRISLASGTGNLDYGGLVRGYTAIEVDVSDASAGDYTVQTRFTARDN